MVGVLCSNDDQPKFTQQPLRATFSDQLIGEDMLRRFVVPNVAPARRNCPLCTSIETKGQLGQPCLEASFKSLTKFSCIEFSEEMVNIESIARRQW